MTACSESTGGLGTVPTGCIEVPILTEISNKLSKVIIPYTGVKDFLLPLCQKLCCWSTNNRM
jgi:hypothetical protein